MDGFEPLNRFSDRATDYAQFRPGYAAAAIAAIVASSDRPQPHIADIGAGTGISSRLLAAAGARVIAIEPNSAMRQAAEPHPQVKYQAGQAEATGLPGMAFDLVTCCQAFHWFEPVKSLQEFHRILAPSGLLALMWNDRDDRDGFTAAYGALIRRIAGDQYFNHVSHRSLEQVEQSPWFGNLAHYSYSYRQPLSFAALLGRCRSSSYIPTSGQPYRDLVAGLKTLYQQWAGDDNTVALAYQSQLYIAPRKS